MGGKKTEPYFLTSPLLFLLYIFYLLFTFPACTSLLPSLSITSLFPSAAFSVCFPACNAAHRTSTRSQEHAKYVPTPLRHVVMFSKSCVENKAAWSQVSRRRPEKV